MDVVRWEGLFRLGCFAGVLAVMALWELLAPRRQLTVSRPARWASWTANRPTPPADIPTSRPPMDLRADAAAEPAKEERPTIGDDMLSAAKSVFHAVLPK